MIVPVYNTEKYLARCVNSILTQTYTNLEIILVDDGSKDTSPVMCDEFARGDERVRVIHTNNMGASSARNTGLDVAKGGLIAFVDSDDVLMPEMYSRLYDLMTRNNADVAICEFIRTDEALNEVPDPNSPKLEPGVISGADAFLKLIRGGEWHYMLLWNKLYRAEIFASIRLNPAYFHEDEELAGRLLCSCGRIAVTYEAMYLYVNHSNSLIIKARSIPFNTRTFREVNAITQDRCRILREMGLNDDAFRYEGKKIYNLVLSALRSINYMQYREILSEKIHRAMKILLTSKEIGYKLRAVKLALYWVMSLFRPFVKD